MSYWVSNERVKGIVANVEGWHAIKSVRDLNYTLLRISGMQASLWRRKLSGTTCSCVGSESQGTDRKCMSCYGTEYLGGYDRYGYTNEFFVASQSNLTLEDTEATPHTLPPTRIRLRRNAILGYVTTPDILIVNPLGSVIEYDFRAYYRDETRSNITLHYSIDGGTYKLINSLANEVLTNCNLRFRMTMVRTELSVKSPLFEVLRIHYATSRTPYIYISKNRPVYLNEKGLWGMLEKEEGITLWTTDEPEIQQNDVVQALDGMYAGERYVIFRPARSEPLFDRRTLQAFKGRRDYDEIFSRVW